MASSCSDGALVHRCPRAGRAFLLIASIASLRAILRAVDGGAAAFHVGAYLLLLRGNLALNERGPNQWYYWLNGVVAVSNLVVLGGGALGWLAAPTSSIYGFGVASCVLLAGFAFIGVLRLPESPAA